ncbi:MAG: polysaccharide deacetylase family protein [Candidatus Uhrbacteria bacterium]|nr:polysaccharide deacetylase family protein [Candidatus Uhrbacteria bacterium]
MKHHLIALFFAASVAALTIGFVAALVLPMGYFTSSRVYDRKTQTVTLNDQVIADATSSAPLHLDPPPLERLTRIAGDPPVQKGEISVRIPILMYHQIRPTRSSFAFRDKFFSVTPESLEAQLKALVVAGYETVTPQDLIAALTEKDGATRLPKKPVLITFDDGYRNQYQYAFPLLKRLGLKATFFIISQGHRWRGYVTEEMIKELDQSGFITIASHTQHHAMLPRYGAAAREREIGDSKKELETLLGHPVTSFAYPYGGWSVEISKEVERAGYQLGFGVRLGSLHTSSSRYQLRRMHVNDREDVVALCDRFLKPLRISSSISQP